MSVDNSIEAILIESSRVSCQPLKTLADLFYFVKYPPNWASLTELKKERGAAIVNIPLGDHHCHVDESQWANAIANRTHGDHQPRPELLVCHDMKNNYLEDRFVHGHSNHSAYRFYRWSAVDIFVYFSHHFITIPPLGWINSAHRHGVNIFGTVITEWTQGSRICTEMLESDEKMKRVVQSLAHVCKVLKLDGWLINIENSVADVSKLRRFVELLTIKQHQEVPGSRVIWYDSVIENGALSWQNELNRNNKIFYDACDGIFLNYTWTLQHLQRTLDVVGSDKAHTVFVGVDVFGRSQYGGGGFRTKVAVDLIYNHGFSTALFAPAWTHETICQPVSTTGPTTISCKIIQVLANSFMNTTASDDVPVSTHAKNVKASDHNYKKSIDFLQIFLNREDLFWTLLQQYYPTKELVNLPFVTSFCLGSGLKKWKNGQVENDRTWFNINRQQIQPSVESCPLRYQHAQDELNTNADKTQNSDIILHNCVDTYFGDSFIGGSCLKFTKISNAKLSNYVTRLFVCDFDITDSAYIRVVTKSQYNLNMILLAQAASTILKITLNSQNSFEKLCQPDSVESVNDINYKEYVESIKSEAASNADKRFSEDGAGVAADVEDDNSNYENITLEPLSDDNLVIAEKKVLEHYGKLYIHPGEKNGWNIRYFLLPNKHVYIREIGMRLEGPAGCIALLGEIALLPINC